MYLNYDMIIHTICSLVILACAWRTFHGKFEPKYYAYAMLAMITTTFYNLLKYSSVGLAIPLIIQTATMCYCLYIHVNGKRKNA